MHAGWTCLILKQQNFLNQEAYLPSSERTKRRGSGETLMNPGNGTSISSTKNKVAHNTERTNKKRHHDSAIPKEQTIQS
jgi:hypothetical protein